MQHVPDIIVDIYQTYRANWINNYSYNTWYIYKSIYQVNCLNMKQILPQVLLLTRHHQAYHQEM